MFNCDPPLACNISLLFTVNFQQLTPIFARFIHLKEKLFKSDFLDNLKVTLSFKEADINIALISWTLLYLSLHRTYIFFILMPE